MNNQILVEGLHGTGGKKNKLDLRDTKWHNLANALPPFDWSKGYDIEQELSVKLNNPIFKIPVKDQGVSSSCVGQASAYYEEVQIAFDTGVFAEVSAKDAYSQIFYPDGGGSTTRDAFNLRVNKGICKESLMSSYINGQPPTEEFMESRLAASKTTIQDALLRKASAYGDVRITIDDFAQALEVNHGLIFKINGTNNGTWRSQFPLPPKIVDWEHELYVGKAKMINGKKYVGILNSWGTNVGDGGWQWLGEDYFDANYMDSAGVIYDTLDETLNHEKSLLEQVLAYLQQLYFNITHTNSKLSLG